MNNFKKTIALISSFLITVSTMRFPTVQASGEGSIEAMIKWAEDIAEDDSHGYKGGAWGPDYDCGTFVVSALRAGGFTVGSACGPSNLKEQMTKYGFKWIPWSELGGKSGLQRGDILLDVCVHTEIYIGDDTNVGAHSNRGNPETGDKTGKEIFVGNYWNNYGNVSWDGVLRFCGKIPDPPKETLLPWNYTYPTRNLKQKSPYMNGDDVKWLQSALSYMGYTCTVDGKLGPATAQQIRQYQSDKGLTVDGVAGVNTLQSLKNDAEAKKNAASNGITSNTSLFTNLFTMGQRVLKYVQGNLLCGDDVKWVQAALNKLIGANLVVDGIFGSKTQEQVKAFQALQGLYQSGEIVAKTYERIQQMLLDENYTPPQQPTRTILRYGYSEPTGNLKNGSKGDTVRWLQVALNNTIGTDLNIDGHYGAKTTAAVKSFQSKYGLSADGIFGKKSLAKMKEVLASKNITICGGTETPSTAMLSLGKNKLYYADEESILFEFDSDTGEKFKISILDANGNVVYDYITEEYSMAVALPPGEYKATLTASNDLGAAISDSIDFTVIKQSEMSEEVAQIYSKDYGFYVSYDTEKGYIYATTEPSKETVWAFTSYDDWSFNIYNVYTGQLLSAENNELSLVPTTDSAILSSNCLWYMYEENGMKFIKSMASDRALTISSNGVISLKDIDVTSNAQNLEFILPSKAELLPNIEKIDDSHAKLTWNKYAEAQKYNVFVFDHEGITEDGLFLYTVVDEPTIEIEIPETEYSICIEPIIEGKIIVSVAIEDGKIVDDSFEYETPPAEDDSEYDNLISYAVQLQRFLLGCDDGYSPSVINSLDMNSDSRIDVYDFILLKRFIIESK